MGADTLQQVLLGLPASHDPRLLVGGGDDAAVVEMDNGLLLVQTVDFFTPVVDDPYLFGQIAATNSLSDVYAMGGHPVTAMNIACFPTKTLGPEVLGRILAGGAAKIQEAGCILAGGHTVEDAEPKYGLSVTGVVTRDQLLRRSGAQVGDRLILTKPIGTGILTTALKRGLVSEAAIAVVVDSMRQLNDRAAAYAARAGAHAATDITGFGLLGHAAGMADDSAVTLHLRLQRIPLFPGVHDALAKGAYPGGSAGNLTFFGSQVDWGSDVSLPDRQVMADAQTSGGLLLAVPHGGPPLPEGFVEIGAVEPRGSFPLRVTVS